MQRWRHAGRGPKCTLLVGVLLGVASVVLYQSAYAAAVEPPYPGSPATPSISNGPPFGCAPTGTSNATFVCGFNALSSVTFTVNGRAAGTGQADSNGCVLVTVSFSLGKVSVDDNAPVPTHVGTNYVVVKGKKTNASGVTYTVGLRISFLVPHGNDRSCVAGVTTLPTTGPTSPPTTPPTGVSTSFRPPSHRQVFTTSTRFNPTTLAKVIETPLQISPNRVILVSSLLAAVLAAVLSAGALGSLWYAGERVGPAGVAGAVAVDDAGAAPPDTSGGAGGPPAPEPTGTPTPEAGGDAPDAPAPEPGGGGGAGGSAAARATSAFVRPPRGGGGR
jgi:hypothetical protein